jgi:hypothetical protein
MSSMSIGGLPEREDRPALVRFEIRAIENKPRSLLEGHYCADDVEFALTTPPYSKDVFPQKVKVWLEQLDVNVRNGRLPPDWANEYKKQYQAWKNGQELPPNGTAIKGWPVISPAQQSNLLHINILTVEDLAAVNDEGAKRIGMGALELKNKARAWLAQRNDKGPLTMEIAAVKSENEQLKASLTSMKAQMDAMEKRLNISASVDLQTLTRAAAAPPLAITANDILPDGDDFDDTKE